jgi:hypothetical protein
VRIDGRGVVGRGDGAAGDHAEQDVAVADSAARGGTGLDELDQAADARGADRGGAAEDLELADDVVGGDQVIGGDGAVEPAGRGRAELVAGEQRDERHRGPPTSTPRSCIDQIRGFLIRREPVFW